MAWGPRSLCLTWPGVLKLPEAPSDKHGDGDPAGHTEGRATSESWVGRVEGATQVSRHYIQRFSRHPHSHRRRPCVGTNLTERGPGCRRAGLGHELWQAPRPCPAPGG